MQFRPLLRPFSFVVLMAVIALGSVANAQLTLTNIPSYSLYTRVNGRDAANVLFNPTTDQTFFNNPTSATQTSSHTGSNPLGDLSISATVAYNSTVLADGLTESASASYAISLAPGGETTGLLATARADAGVWAFTVSSPTWVYFYGSANFSDVNNGSAGISLMSFMQTSPFTGTTLAQIDTTQNFNHTFLFVPGLNYHLTGNAELTRTFGQALNDETSYTFTLSTTAPVAAVPEPATYAMIAGLAVLGWSLWRRRSSAIF